MKAAAQTQTQVSTLPAIGQPWPGLAGNYAGITTGADGALYALISLDARPSKDLTWREAMDWSASIEADLPNRVEGALLFANLKDQFEPEWHWLNEQYSASYAWTQDFNDGYQGSINKSAAGRARAVRRLPLQSFNPFEGLAKRSAESSAQMRGAATALLAACDAADAAIGEVLEAA